MFSKIARRCFFGLASGFGLLSQGKSIFAKEHDLFQMETKKMYINTYQPMKDLQLFKACRLMDIESVSYLLSIGANPNIFYPMGTALSLAIKSERLDMAKLLLRHGANINGKYGYNDCNIIMYLYPKFSENGLKFMLDNGVNINSTDNFEDDILKVASTKGDKNLVSFLLNCGAKGVDNALVAAVCNGHEDVVDALLKSGANIDTLGETGYSALHVAIEGGFNHLAIKLIEKGASVNVKNVWGCTPLDTAKSYKNKELVDFLTKTGIF